MLALIDADILTYSIPFSLEKEEDVTPERLDERISSFLRNIKDDVAFSDYKFFLTGQGNFREKLPAAKKYKGNREDFVRPQLYKACRDLLTDNYKAIVVDGMEADDAIAIEHIKMRELDEPSCIVSLDKDLDQIAGWHYRWAMARGDRLIPSRIYNVSPTNAMRSFYKQILTGDRVDNIEGVEGIGAKKASKIVDSLDDELAMYCACLDCYNEWLYPLYGDELDIEEQMNNNAALLYMLRHEQDKWEPPFTNRIW
jgi:5'-3' exonuclease